jgi:hypothetical protein
VVRSLVIALLATGAAAANSAFVSGAAEPRTGTVSVGYGFTFEASNGPAPLQSSEACDAGVQIRYPWALYLVSPSETAPKRFIAPVLRTASCQIFGLGTLYLVNRTIAGCRTAQVRKRDATASKPGSVWVCYLYGGETTL